MYCPEEEETGSTCVSLLGCKKRSKSAEKHPLHDHIFVKSNISDTLDLHICCSKARHSSIGADGCCMFRTRRNNLWRKLWKLRKACGTTNSKMELASTLASNKQTDGKHIQKDVNVCEFLYVGESKKNCDINLSYKHVNNIATSSSTVSKTTPTEQDLKDAAWYFQKSLSIHQLEILLKTIETNGEDDLGCVLIDHTCSYMKDVTITPYFLTCKLWRWPELDIAHPLKKLVCCSDAISDSNSTVCCNPYHYSRVIFHPEVNTIVTLPQQSSQCDSCLNTSPSPHPDDTGSIRKLPHCDSSTYSSQETFVISDEDHPTSGSRCLPWCNLAYWEHIERVGRLFSVSTPSIDVFGEMAKGSGFCLAAIAPPPSRDHRCEGCERSRAMDKIQRPSAEEVACVMRTRERIGRGITLSREGCSVWVYNRSATTPVFLNSSTITSSNHHAVVKLMPGFSVRAFDYHIYSSSSLTRSAVGGPEEAPFINLSFGKGWGRNYKRQVVTSCPCWLQVLVSIPPPPHR